MRKVELRMNENIDVSYDFIYKTLTKKGILSHKARKKTKREYVKWKLLLEKKKYIPPMSHLWKLASFKKQIQKAHTNHVYA